jgi:hypothetical protein
MNAFLVEVVETFPVIVKVLLLIILLLNFIIFTKIIIMNLLNQILGINSV